MATLPLFTSSTPEELTFDTDDNRLNDYPSVIRDKNGRIIIFYEKSLKSGRLSDGEVTFTSPSLSCHIDLGNGEINGSPISWLAADLALTPNSYTLIYVDNIGTVSHTTSFSMTLTKNSILLALVNVGGSTIVRINSIEKNGKYIFYRKQVLSGSNYIWDDFEYRLNVGEKPAARYDSVNDKIYISYQRDDSTYVRLFNINDPLTWEDLIHFEETGGILYIKPAPVSDSIISGGTSQGQHQLTLPDLFALGRNMAFGFRLEGALYVPYVHLPYVTSSYLNDIVGDVTLEIFTKSGDTYNLETSFVGIPLGADQYVGLNVKWLHSVGLKYLGIRLRHNLFSTEFTTESRNYLSRRIQAERDYTELTSPTTYETTIYHEVTDSITGAVSAGKYTKTFEAEQLYDFETESEQEIIGAVSTGKYTKTFEAEQLYNFETESEQDITGAVSVGLHTIVNV